MDAQRAPAVWLIDDNAAPVDAERATALGLSPVSSPPATGFYVLRDHAGLGLTRAEDADRAILRCALADTAELDQRRTGGRRSPLARAFGLHRHPPMRVLDTTAGLARDAATLAGLGCVVTAIERQPALYALLADASDAIHARAGKTSGGACWRPPIHADARTWLANRKPDDAFEAIYIDPMFASPRRKSAPQKAMAWLSALAGTDDDAPALLAAARNHATRRVVVKQHARAEPMAPPDLQVEGRAIRFDIYLTPA